MLSPSASEPPRMCVCVECGARTSDQLYLGYGADGGGDANAMRPSSDGSGLPVIFKWTHGGQQVLAEQDLKMFP